MALYSNKGSRTVNKINTEMVSHSLGRGSGVLGKVLCTTYIAGSEKARLTHRILAWLCFIAKMTFELRTKGGEGLSHVTLEEEPADSATALTGERVWLLKDQRSGAVIGTE